MSHESLTKLSLYSEMLIGVLFYHNKVNNYSIEKSIFQKTQRLLSWEKAVKLWKIVSD